MREKDIRAVTEILFEIRNNPVITPGFEILLYKYGYWGIKDLCKTFQRLCDSMDEWGNQYEYIHIMEDIKMGTLSQDAQPEDDTVHAVQVRIDMTKWERKGYNGYKRQV